MGSRKSVRSPGDAVLVKSKSGPIPPTRPLIEDRVEVSSIVSAETPSLTPISMASQSMEEARPLITSSAPFIHSRLFPVEHVRGQPKGIDSVVIPILKDIVTDGNWNFSNDIPIPRLFKRITLPTRSPTKKRILQ